jgi:hypothetical protein
MKLKDPAWLKPVLKMNAAQARSGIAIGIEERTYICMGTVKSDDSRITWDALSMAQRDLFEDNL